MVTEAWMSEKYYEDILSLLPRGELDEWLSAAEWEKRGLVWTKSVCIKRQSE